MRALVFDGALRFEPEWPNPDRGLREALVRVRLAGICGTDLEILSGYKGFSGVLGHEFVGEVVDSPEDSWLGRRVCGEINIGCGDCRFCRAGVRAHCDQRAVLGILGRSGAFADLIALPLENLHQIPDEVPDEHAVFAEPLAAAFEILEQVRVGPEVSCAVVGDGRLGILCAQVLFSAGADVTVFGHHSRKLELLRSLGIEGALSEDSLEPRFDMVVEATGSAAGLAAALHRVRPRGTVVLKSTYSGAIPLDLSPAVVNEVTIVGSRCGPFSRALEALRGGDVQVEQMIDAIYPLEEGLDAMARAGASGTLKVLLRMEASERC